MNTLFFVVISFCLFLFLVRLLTVDLQLIRLHFLIINLRQEGKYLTALEFARKAYLLAENKCSLNHPFYLHSINNLALLYQYTQKYEEALPLFKKSLNIAHKKFGNNHINTAISLNNLASLYHLMQRHEEALVVYKQSLNICQKVLKFDHPQIATIKANLAELYDSVGRYEEALDLYQDSLTINQKVFGVDHSDTQISLLNLKLSLAKYYDSIGKKEDIEAVFKDIGEYQSEDILENLSKLDNLEKSLELEGKYEIALIISQTYLEFCKSFLDIDNPLYSTAIDNLSRLYCLMGQYEQALPFSKESLKIRQTFLELDNPDIAVSLTNIAELYRSMGRYEEALPLFKESLDIRLKVLGANDANTINSLNKLAEIYLLTEQYTNSLIIMKISLEIFQKGIGVSDSNLISKFLKNIAELLALTSNYKKEILELLPFIEKAVLMQKNVFGFDHLDTAFFLDSLAKIYQIIGRYSDALPLYQKSLEIKEFILGVYHFDTAISLTNISILLTSINHINALQAFNIMHKANNIELKNISQIFKLSSERQRLKLINQNYSNFEIFISLIFQYLPNSPEAIQSAFELIQKRKFIVTETTILQKNALLSGRYPQLNTLFKEYQEKTQQIITLTFQTLTEAQQNYRNQLIQEQQEIEAELSRQIPELNLERKLLEIDRHTVALELPENSTLLEFVRFNVFDYKAIPANGDTYWKPARYLAFILPAGQPEQIQMIDLGEAENIDRLIKVFRENIIQGKSDGSERVVKKMKSTEQLNQIKTNPELDEVFQNKQQLKQLLFDPIQKYLPADSQKLIIAPDGELNLLPFELLPVNNHQYLMDEYTISYVNVGRDLIRLKFPSTTQPTQPLIIANPDYNLNDENAVICQDTPTKTERSIDTVYSDLRKSQPDGMFAPIPGTGLESVEISRYLGVTPQTEKNALESLVKSQLSPRILHIATHGYFLTIENLKPLKDTPFSQLDSLHRAGMQNLQNPLARSGLAFAGANTALNGGRLPAAAEDGILTAQDVATFLDLSATELVVLSACESGLGEVKLGESVHGLRHAFLQTGAKSLIVSLWAVNDISTAILMGQFYHYYLEDKKPVGKALELAKRYVCNLTVGQMRDTWLTDEKIEYVGRYSEGMEDKLRILRNNSDDYQPYKHPKYWGAFIYLGLTD